MIEAKTTAGTLLAWMRTIGAVVAHECILDTSELDVVTICVVDPANAQMVSIRIPDHAWAHLEVDGSSLGVNVESLIEKIEQCQTLYNITLTTETQKGHPWLKIIDGDDSFRSPLFDLSQVRKTPTEPIINSAARFTTSANTLQQIITRAEVVSDCVRIGMDPTHLNVWARAEGEPDIYEAQRSGKAIIIHKAAEVSSLFSLDYLTAIAPHLRGDVVVGLGEDEAIQLCYDLHGASVRYIQAPRIEP